MFVRRGKYASSAASQKQVIPHTQFMNRIRKSLYFGVETIDDDMELSHPMAEYASELFNRPHKGHSLNRLNSVAAGSVHATPCSLIMALIYLDRLNVCDPCYVRRITPQELFIVSMMISTKFYAGYDEEIYLSDWAEDGHMTEDRLKKLELEFLDAINWNIYISNEQFFIKLEDVEKTIAQREGLRRGWLTYTELEHLLPSFAIAKFLLKNITVMALSYAAGVITIAGAFFLASQIPGNALYRTQKSTTTAIKEKSNTRISEDNIIHKTTDIQKHNGTECCALNAEAELLQLELQYLKESVLEDLRNRHNEISTYTRLTLPNASVEKFDGKNSLQNNIAHDTQYSNWFIMKEEYTDQRAQLSFDVADLQKRNRSGNSPINLNKYNNISLNLSTGALCYSVVRSTLLWFKFM